MKVTKRQLRKIIQEEKSRLNENSLYALYQKDPAGSGKPRAAWEEHHEEIVFELANYKMKVTKRQLRKIIRENTSPAPMKSRATPEIRAAVSNSHRQNMLKEGIPSVQFAIPAGEKIWAALSSIIDQWMDQTDPQQWYELANDLRGYADDVEDSVPDID
jgi:hypothetical protein